MGDSTAMLRHNYRDNFIPKGKRDQLNRGLLIIAITYWAKETAIYSHPHLFDYHDYILSFIAITCKSYFSIR